MIRITRIDKVSICLLYLLALLIYPRKMVMSYNEDLAERIRRKLRKEPSLEELKMMGGLCFMINDKMCVGVMKEELMCRIDPKEYDNALEQPGCNEMSLGGKTMKGYVLIDETGMQTERAFDYWIDLSLDFNPKAKSSKKKK